MRRFDGRACGRRWRVALAVAAWAASSLVADAGEAVGNARLRLPAERMAVAQAIRGAARRLGQAECQALLEEFTDASGRPLRTVLEAQVADVGEYLDRVMFYDAPPEACEAGPMLAGAVTPGSRAIRVCGRRFLRAVNESAEHAEAVIIHEMLHSLGLGENPPTSDYITSRVRAQCRG
jgi:hypothetical protein